MHVNGGAMAVAHWALAIAARRPSTSEGMAVIAPILKPPRV